MSIDTSLTRISKQNKAEMFASILGCSVILLGTLSVIWFDTGVDFYVKILGGILIIFFCILIIFATARLINGNVRVLTLSPEGFHDTGISREFVPWSAVTGMKIASTYFQGRQRFIAVDLKIRDSVWDGLTLTRLAKFNKRFQNTVWVVHVGKERDFESFFAMMQAYVKDHGGIVD